MQQRRDRVGRFTAIVCGLALVSSAQAAPPPRFPSGSVWHQDITAADVHDDSAAMIARLAELGGWGNANRMQIDFSFHVRHVAEDENPPRFPVVAAYNDPLDPEDDDYYSPDCEAPGTLMPVPADSAFEGQGGLQCDNYCGDDGDPDATTECGDCHLIVVEDNLLYELYSGDFDGSELNALCLAVWDTNVVYPSEGRGEHCTSADAAGFPIAALLPNADEVAAAAALPDGDLGHAIRFILPNAFMASDDSLGGNDGKLYVRPASHAGGPNGPVDTVPYGARLRLRDDFAMGNYNAAARVILRTMQRCGIVLADGGNIALTFESDRFTKAKWNDLGMPPQVFWNGEGEGRTPVRVTDFVVLDTGPRIAETYDCVRSSVVPGDGLFGDGFED